MFGSPLKHRVSAIGKPQMNIQMHACWKPHRFRQRPGIGLELIIVFFGEIHQTSPEGQFSPARFTLQSHRHNTIQRNLKPLLHSPKPVFLAEVMVVKASTKKEVDGLSRCPSRASLEGEKWWDGFIGSRRTCPPSTS